MQIGASLSVVPQGIAVPQLSRKEFIATLDIVSRIALAVIATITSATMFGSTLCVGILWGLYEHHTQPDSCSHDHAFAGCGQGFMERMAGMHFRPELSIFANLAVTICHIDHHPIVFVPYCGIALGMWIGQLAYSPLHQAVRWIQHA